MLGVSPAALSTCVIGERVGARRKRHLRDLVGHLAVAEARLEIGERLLRRRLPVEALDDLLRERDLDVARVAAGLDLAAPPVDVVQRPEREQLEVAPHQLSEIDISLPNISCGGSSMPT